MRWFALAVAALSIAACSDVRTGGGARERVTGWLQPTVQEQREEPPLYCYRTIGVVKRGKLTPLVL